MPVSDLIFISPLSNLKHVLNSALKSPLTKLTLLYVALAAFGGNALNAQAPTAFPGSTLVGVASSPIGVSLTLTHTGVVTTAQVLTQGVANADFILASGGTCTVGTSYTAGQQCTVNVVFQPKFPGQRVGVAVLQASDGSVLASTLLAGVGNGPLAVLQPGRIDTIAGNGAWIYHSDGVAATSAPIFLPTGVAIDAGGNLYLSDSANNRVRRVDAGTGLISTVAGNGSPGFSGDGAAATLAMISAPAGLVIDGAGDIYFVDSGNHAVRRVDAFSGIITTIAGTGAQGYSGDAGLATAAKLSLPEGIAFDALQNLYIADTGNNVVRKVDPATGIIRTVAGTGVSGYNGDARLATTATLSSPWNIAVSANGSLYIADLNNNRVRKVDTGGIISTTAGTGGRAFSGDGSAATAAALNSPAAIVFDPAGNLYIADSANNRVRKVDATTGLISTITGTGDEGFSGDTGPSTVASLYGPYSLFFDQAGNLTVADMFHNRVRRISSTAIALTYDTIRVGKISPPQSEGLQNDGNGNLNLALPVFSNAALDSVTTTCTVGVLTTNTSCLLGVEFAPTVVGNLVLGSVTMNSDAGNSPNVISISGQVLTVEPTSTALASSVNPSLLNSAVIFTATVTSDDTSRSGPVTFFDGTTVLCASVNLSASGTATCSVSALALGQHNITASYAGDANNAASVTPVLVQTVLQTAVLTLTAIPNPAVVTSVVSLTLTATANTGTPTGVVTFYDGTTAIKVANLNSGTASFTTALLSVATHSLSVMYAGDAADASGTSNIVSEVISQASTLTMLGSSNATVPVGAAVTLTANVSSTNGPAPTGTVQFMDGSVVIGNKTLDVNGVATFTLSTLTPGSHNIIVTYGGDTNDAGSTSAALIETIQQLGTNTLLASDTNPANAGVTVHITATVSIATGATAAGTITGLVTFTEGANVLGSGPINSAGVTTISVNSLAVGSHPVVATYAGNTNYAGNASAALNQQIQQTATVSTVSSSNSGSLSGQTVTFTASVVSASGIPAGTVSFLDGSTNLGQATLNAQGVATISLSSLAVGNHTITSVYAGSVAYATSTSSSLTESITLAITTATLVGPANPVNAGTTATFSVTLTSPGIAPTGQLTLRDGGVLIGAQAVTGIGTFAFTTSTLSIGTHTLSASYAGNANNAPSSSNNITTVVQQAPTATLLQSSKNPQIIGQSVTLTAQVTSISPNLTGSVTFQDGSVQLGTVALNSNGIAIFSTNTLAAGSHSMTAVFSGDTNHVGSTSIALNEQIVLSAQVALSSSLNPSPSGANLILTTKVSGASSTSPGGSVAFLDGSTLLGSVTLDATGSASLSSSSLAVGTHSITVSYAGDQNFATATSAVLLQTIQNSSTQVALTASVTSATYALPVTFTAVITTNGGIATGTVSFTDGIAPIGNAILNVNGVAVLTLSTLSPGSHNIIANYLGDGKASASVSVPLMVSVRQVTAVVVSSNANPSLTLSTIVLSTAVTETGVTTPGGTVTFSDGSTQLGVATLDANGRGSITVPSLSAGSHSIQASYSGDSADFVSVSNTMTQVITLRSTVTALTATATNTDNTAQVTLISVVRWTGPATPTGTITFKSGSIVVGSVPVDATGVATITIFVQLGTETVTASYSGDGAYATSNSIATTVTSGPATQFSLQIAPPTMTVASKQHGVVNLTVSSVKGFSDMMQFGCLGLPFAATCTFSNPQIKLAADGTSTVQLTIDTGNPLGAGAQAKNIQGNSAGVVMRFLPGALITGFLLWRKRRRMPVIESLFLFLAMVTTLSAAGCSGLQSTGTPVGAYSFQVTAYGQGTGASESQTMTLTVTQ